MKSHTHTCPDCGDSFRCTADVIDNVDGSPERLCAAEAGHYELIKPLCEACHDTEGESQDELGREA